MSQDQALNLSLPGNPRTQPKDLVPYFGYDHLARSLVEVELAVMLTMAHSGFIPEAEFDLLTPEIEDALHAITTTQMDEIERAITKHDIRALVRLMQEILPEPLRRWVHVPLTSYDVIETARTLQFVRSYEKVIKVKVRLLIETLVMQASRYAETVQIGRTHGQHALPITLGFWFSTILSRVLANAAEMDRFAGALVGKLSGAVGAYNAQSGLGIDGRLDVTFEESVLAKLGLKPAPISTQILPPEPLAYYLFSCLMLSGTLGQIGRDGRNLARTEIGEVNEPFAKGQVGSSTMAHKRNPINFEGVEGEWEKNKAEFFKVLSTIVSEHQRDLVGSRPSRDFPILIVNLVSQLDTLLRPDKDGTPFLSGLRIDQDSCARNLCLQGDKILAEPLYIALQMAGYEGDAHDLINHRAMRLVGGEMTLVGAIESLAEEDAVLGAAWRAIPADLHALFREPHNYTGQAEAMTRATCERAEEFLKFY